MELMPVATEYKSPGLVSLCEWAVQANLCVENVVDSLIMSEKYECIAIFQSCLPIYKANASNLKADCKEKLKDYPDLLLKLAEGCAQ